MTLDFKSSIKSSTVVVKELKLLSSAKLWADAIKKKKTKKKSLENTLNNVGANIQKTGKDMFEAILYTNTLLSFFSIWMKIMRQNIY